MRTSSSFSGGEAGANHSTPMSHSGQGQCARRMNPLRPRSLRVLCALCVLSVEAVSEKVFTTEDTEDRAAKLLQGLARGSACCPRALRSGPPQQKIVVSRHICG